MAEELFKISPSRGPFQFHTWLELPFPLAVKVRQKFVSTYKSYPTEVEIVIKSNIYKVVTGSFWQQGREVHEKASRVRSGQEEPSLVKGWEHEYIARDEVYGYVTELEHRENTRYVHVEEIPAVVHAKAFIPSELIPDQDFFPYDLSPQHDFINKEIFSELQEIIDVYRVAARPWMRYAISPVSEALVDRALIRFTDSENVRVGGYYYGFDVKSPTGVGIIPAIQERFDNFSGQISSLQAENQMASAYYLYRMRRWTEAITLASAVVDSLLKDLVFQIASTEIEAEAIWVAYGYRYKDLFNKVFPKFDKPKLSEVNKTLWNDFVEAKKNRGSRVHGNYSSPFDKDQEISTKHSLSAFHDVARWIAQQMGYDWALDCFDENNELLEPFS